MPFDGNRWRPEKLVPYNTLLGNIQDRFGPLEKVSDDPNDTSKHWKVPGYAGSIGFITRYETYRQIERYGLTITSKA